MTQASQQVEQSDPGDSSSKDGQFSLLSIGLQTALMHTWPPTLQHVLLAPQKVYILMK